MIIDAEGMVAGRLATSVAKRLLAGEEITIVNAEKAIIIGKPENTFSDFMKRREIGRPQKGPFYPRRPDMMLRRMVRGMLPIKKPKGREAYKRLKVYIGIPEGIDISSAEKPGKHESQARAKYVTIGEVARRIGWKA